jgi:putative transposase
VFLCCINKAKGGAKMYTTEVIMVKQTDEELMQYCNNLTSKSKLLKNAVIFRYRQLFSAQNKQWQKLSENEQQVIEEFKSSESKYKTISDTYYCPSYNHIEYVLKTTGNPDYYSGLPIQTVQQEIKEVKESFNAFWKSIKDYSKHPEKYNGKPQLPGYIKTDKAAVTITNQDAVVKENNCIKLPKTKVVIDLGQLKLRGKLKEITIIPFYNTYKINIVTESIQAKINLNKNAIIGIDLGINNFVTTSNNVGLTPFIINGKILKSYNQHYNEQKAFLYQSLAKCQQTNIYTSKRLRNLDYKHYCYLNNAMHQMSHYIINYCITHNIGTIVIGHNQQWKQSINLGKANNYTFCMLTHTQLINQIKNKANVCGIDVIVIEEEYTSKASFLDNDDIPSFDGKEHQFSGRRKTRGCYISKAGIHINADVNGASNIIRKAVPAAFTDINDYSYLYYTVTKINIGV